MDECDVSRLAMAFVGGAGAARVAESARILRGEPCVGNVALGAGVV